MGWKAHGHTIIGVEAALPITGGLQPGDGLSEPIRVGGRWPPGHGRYDSEDRRPDAVLEFGLKVFTRIQWASLPIRSTLSAGRLNPLRAGDMRLMRYQSGLGSRHCTIRGVRNHDACNAFALERALKGMVNSQILRQNAAG
jgi:hypothetical protein